ncbi:MAG: hypothetical protein LN563_02915 [Rickettsia endosymbiont of Platyusa sonomae]|nr:hypothetical protein [Rickettsia endosymbiont of Platyusa sonomae]
MEEIQASFNHYILEPALKKFGELVAVCLSCKLVGLVYLTVYPETEPVQIEKVLGSFAFHFVQMQLKKQDCPPELKNFVDERGGSDKWWEAYLVGEDSTNADSL